MGLSINKSEFPAEDFERFAAKVRTDLSAFVRLLNRPGFGEGESSIGAEVEWSGSCSPPSGASTGTPRP